MPFPWRENRCHCGRLAIGSINTEPYCSFHLPFRQFAEEYLEKLYDLIGQEKRNELIDERFPDNTFNWEDCYYWAKDLYITLNIETGLLAI